MTDPLLVDAYADDPFGPDWSTAIKNLVEAGLPWCGLVLKMAEADYYPRNRPSDLEWCLDNWLRPRVYARERYGKTWFRGAYLYVRIDRDPVAQANNFLGIVDEAGGWGPGDLWPILDVESGENPPGASARQIEDVVSAISGKILQATGRASCLYGNVYLAERGVNEYMGCGTLIVPRYTPTLPPTIYERIGWTITKPPQMPTVFGWQYSGAPDGGELADYPTKCPMSDTHNADITALIVAGGGQAALDWTAANLTTGPLSGPAAP